MKRISLLHDAYVCFVALFCESTEGIAKEAMKQHAKRELRIQQLKEKK